MCLPRYMLRNRSKHGNLHSNLGLKDLLQVYVKKIETSLSSTILTLNTSTSKGIEMKLTFSVVSGTIVLYLRIYLSQKMWSFIIV